MSVELLDDRFRLDGEIGRGGMGVVYRAHDVLLDRQVAIKILTEDARSSQDRERLLREARAIARLNHPNIVSVYDASTVGDATYVIMEQVGGTSLHQLRPKDMRQIVSIASQVCAALDHAHTHGIVHRDLKPENVMVAPDGTAKLMDFGLARPLLSRVTNEGAIVGTVFYIAPEQALGRPVDGRADLYSLGVMLYEMTSGRLPFTADDPLAIISQHIHAPVVPPSTYNEQIPPRLEVLILALLAKDPDDRPVSAAEVGRALDRLGNTEREAGQPITAIDRLVRGRLVGRSQEMARAREAWLQVAGGKSRVLLISGEPGIGKTRLVSELMSQVTVTGGIVLTGECHSGGSTPYAPIAQMIEQAIERLVGNGRGLSNRALADLVRLAPGLQTRFAEVPSNPPLDPLADQHRLCESVLLLIGRLALQAPVTLVVEDIHWADGGTLSLLRYLTSRGHASDLALLSVLTYRDAEVSGVSSLEDLLQDLSRSHLATHVDLTRFNRDQTGEMLAVMFQSEALPEVLDGIYRETEGNPFFIEEVCKTLIEQGKFVHEAGVWHQSTDGVGLAIPSGLRLAIRLRVGKLSEQTQEVLRIAAVIGREFDCDVLQEVSLFGEDLLIEALESAERAQFIEEIRPGGESGHRKCPRFAFVHVLVQHALEESVIGLRRQRLNARVAQALEHLRRDDLNELAPVLARYCAEACEWERAAEYWAMAGDRALSLFAYPEALSTHRQALDIFKERQEYERAARTLMKLGLIHQALFEFDEAHQAFQEGSALWQRVPPMPATELPLVPHAFRRSWFPITTLDPGLGDDYIDAAVAAHLFRGLVERTPEMTVLPDAARGWEVLEGGRRYVFHLREDIRWSDGVPTTARDFEYAWKRCLDPCDESVKAQFLYDIKGARAYHSGEVPTADAVAVQASDDFTLTIDLENPVGYFLQSICNVMPVPRHAVEAYGGGWADAAHIVTNGAFLVDEWRAGECLTLVRNPSFGGRFSGNLQRVEIRMSPGREHVMFRERYEAGEDDLYCPQLPAEEDRARYLYPGEYIISPLAMTSFILFDGGQPPFDDLRVRRAFAHSLDRVTYANVVLGGYLPLATGGIVPPGLPGHLPRIALSHEPERARQLLAEAGYPGGCGFPEVSLAEMGSWEYRRATQYLQGQWRAALGVNVVVEPRAFDEPYPKPRATAAQVLLTGWIADYPDPDSMLGMGLRWHMDTRRHPAVHRLIESARQAMNQRDRIALYQKADRLLIEEAVVVPLVYGRNSFFLKPWVRRFPASAVWSDFWKDIIIAPH